MVPTPELTVAERANTGQHSYQVVPTGHDCTEDAYMVVYGHVFSAEGFTRTDQRGHVEAAFTRVAPKAYETISVQGEVVHVSFKESGYIEWIDTSDPCNTKVATLVE